MNDTAPVALLVEDERQIRRFVRTALEAEGFQIVEAETVRQGLLDAGTRKPDIVILDLGLPDGDGVDFIRDFRAWSSVPVIVLSARAEETDKIEALDAGADDYLTKPFGVGELLARVRAARRAARTPRAAGRRTFRFGDVEVDLARPHRCASATRRAPHADRVPPAGAHDPQRRPRAHAPPDPARGLGAELRRARALRSRPHGPPAPEARGRPGAAEHLLTETAVGYRLVDV